MKIYDSANNELGSLRPGHPKDDIHLLALAEATDLSSFGDPHWNPANFIDFQWPQFKAGQSNRIDLVIDAKEWGPIGTCCLHQIDWRNRNASIGITIYEEDKRNQGMGTATLVALQTWATETLAMKRLEAYILTDNKPSIRLFEKCEFKYEGRLRKRYLRKGELIDVLVYGWLVDE